MGPYYPHQDRARILNIKICGDIRAYARDSVKRAEAVLVRVRQALASAAS